MKKLFYHLPDTVRFFLFKVFYAQRFDSYGKIRREQVSGYSLAESDALQALYIHIPKNGGTSINRALFQSKGGGHLAYYFMQLIYSPSELKSMYKFTIVRNPYSRLYSAYKFLKAGGNTKSDKKWSDKYLADIRSFEEFVMTFLDAQAMLSYIHLKPQHVYACDGRGRVQLDFVGRFEQLEEDFNRIAREIGVETSLTHINKSANPLEFKEHYTAEMLKKVARLYQKDFELFGYDF